uniref:Uncharacterized protein n=1 Tax=Panagrolaimus sp. JU765 TaxID=591449 RepID=A0AC34R9B9_9BILA
MLKPKMNFFSPDLPVDPTKRGNYEMSIMVREIDPKTALSNHWEKNGLLNNKQMEHITRILARYPAEKVKTIACLIPHKCSPLEEFQMIKENTTFDKTRKNWIQKEQDFRADLALKSGNFYFFMEMSRQIQILNFGKKM